jgi:hypothetical protein
MRIDVVKRESGRLGFAHKGSVVGANCSISANAITVFKLISKIIRGYERRTHSYLKEKATGHWREALRAVGLTNNFAEVLRSDTRRIRLTRQT